MGIYYGDVIYLFTDFDYCYGAWLPAGLHHTALCSFPLTQMDREKS